MSIGKLIREESLSNCSYIWPCIFQEMHQVGIFKIEFVGLLQRADPMGVAIQAEDKLCFMKIAQIGKKRVTIDTDSFAQF